MCWAGWRRRIAGIWWPAAPEAADEQAFARGYTAACAFWLLENLNGHLRHAVLEDMHLGTTTWRRRLIGRRRAFVEVAGRTGALPALLDAARKLLAHLHGEWGVELEEFDAFARALDCSPEQVRRFTEGVVAGRVEGVKKVLSMKPALANARSADARRLPMLHLATRTGNVAMVQALLACGADKTVADELGRTAAEVARHFGHQGCVGALTAPGQ